MNRVALTQMLAGNCKRLAEEHDDLGDTFAVLGPHNADSTSFVLVASVREGRKVTGVWRISVEGL